MQQALALGSIVSAAYGQAKKGHNLYEVVFEYEDTFESLDRKTTYI